MQAGKPENFLEVSIEAQDSGVPDRKRGNFKVMEPGRLCGVGSRVKPHGHGFKKNGCGECELHVVDNFKLHRRRTGTQETRQNVVDPFVGQVSDECLQTLLPAPLEERQRH